MILNKKIRTRHKFLVQGIHLLQLYLKAASTILNWILSYYITISKRENGTLFNLSVVAVNNFVIDSMHHIPQKNEIDLATITEITNNCKHNKIIDRSIMEDRLSHQITSNILENIYWTDKILLEQKILHYVLQSHGTLISHSHFYTSRCWWTNSAVKES